ncbi:sugar transporter SWEET1 isoform X1 [Anopheles moucheti]|uniref:sugar transporter SWEET1 isoform X1 n=1 Tax=Anopheles moucheti TaxID=186751 RepID=UPI0022EFE610|nr:sugar transporter SWEET1 isoform X1 [Anopheles moucheti]
MDAILSKGSLASLATVATVLQFLTGTVICNRYIRKKSTGDTSAFPFISGFLSCFMWLKYGVLTEESTLILVNFIGSALFFSYAVVFFIFCVNKREVIRQMMLISCIILSATFYTMFESDVEKSIRIIGKRQPLANLWRESTNYFISSFVSRVGLLCCCLAVLFFASPLTTLAHVIRTQNTDSLPFPIIVASFFVCFLWTAYGVMIGDRFIQVPNLLGGILAGIQLTLYVIYPKKKASASGPRYSPLVSENPIL